MSIIKVRSALEVALFAITPAIAVAWESRKYDPVLGTPYVRCVLLPATPENPTFGDDFHRLQGLLLLEFYYPKNFGSDAAATRAELTKTVFKRGASFTNSGVTTVITGTPEIGQGIVIGDWFILPMRIRWSADIQ